MVIHARNGQPQSSSVFSPNQKALAGWYAHSSSKVELEPGAMTINAEQLAALEVARSGAKVEVLPVGEAPNWISGMPT
jgi:hypothetical protein